MIETKSKELIPEQYLDSLRARLEENKRVRRKLPLWGRVHIDRQLPFLCVYRKPKGRTDTGTQKLLFGEASYVTASGSASFYPGVHKLIKQIAETQTKYFGRMLIVEIWTGYENDESQKQEAQESKPLFTIHATSNKDIRSIAEEFESSLKHIKLQKKNVEAVIKDVDSVAPAGLKPLFTLKELKKYDIDFIGLEINPIYRNKKTGTVYPLILRILHRSLARVLKQNFFKYSKHYTQLKAPHFLSMGRRAVVKSLWEIDDKLADVSNAFSMLLAVTPINTDAAFVAFKRSKFQSIPKFKYSPIPVDPSLLKRALHNIPLERIEDPVLSFIFRQQLDDIDRRLTLLTDRNTSKFLYGSMQIFGGVKNWIFDISVELLRTLPPKIRKDLKQGIVSAEEFVLFAEDEIQYYKNLDENFNASVEIKDNLNGLMVSKGKLLVGTNAHIPRSRVKALIQHEIGTHLLTYYNGKAQPFKQLYVGLASYDELQEGLAVLSEFLVGGLNGSRMRLLAARVVAVRRLIDGATFVDIFRELHSVFGFDTKTAFTITMRVCRGGGLTKDATYLKGLLRLMKYLKEGGDFNTLYIGKFNSDHIPFINELKYRKILKPAHVLPRYIDDISFQEKLLRLRDGINLQDLIEHRTRKRVKK